MPRPITLVDSGGMPITEATWGEPMTPVEAPLYGEPMTLVDSGGVPVVLVNDDLTPYQGVRETIVENGITYFLLRDDDTNEIIRDDDTNEPLYDEAA